MRNFRNEGERGMATFEYAVMLAVIALAVGTATPNIRTALIDIIQTLVDIL